MCPYGAIERKELLDAQGEVHREVAAPNPAMCEGCGLCTVTCRGGYIDLEGYTDEQVFAQLGALGPLPEVIRTMTEANVSAAQSGAGSAPEDWQPHIVALVCNWCSYAGADMAGTTRLEYPANVRMVRFPCTGRMSPLMILRAFEQGADGVLVSGCHPGDCHYVQGNLVARRRFTIFRSLMDFIGIDLKRLHFAWVSAAEGHKWAKVVSEVTAAVQEAGPLPSFAHPEGWDGIELPAMEGSGPQELDRASSTRFGPIFGKAASEVLTTERVGVVIGYGAGSLPEPDDATILITETADCEKLEWGQGCRNNLGAYVGSALEKHERVAVVAKTCDLGAVTGLIREGQLRRDQLLVDRGPVPRSSRRVGARRPSAFPAPGTRIRSVTSWSRSTVFARAVRIPRPLPSTRRTPATSRSPISSRCRTTNAGSTGSDSSADVCAATRAARPVLCATARTCITEKHRPQWVPTSIDNRGNSAWNIIRAVHLAGRCSGCDECARVCPADIRLDLINRKLALEVERQYGKIGLDPEEKSALVDFRMEDSEEFIL